MTQACLGTVNRAHDLPGHGERDLGTPGRRCRQQPGAPVLDGPGLHAWATRPYQDGTPRRTMPVSRWRAIRPYQDGTVRSTVRLLERVL